MKWNETILIAEVVVCYCCWYLCLDTEAMIVTWAWILAALCTDTHIFILRCVFVCFFMGRKEKILIIFIFGAYRIYKEWQRYSLYVKYLYDIKIAELTQSYLHNIRSMKEFISFSYFLPNFCKKDALLRLSVCVSNIFSMKQKRSSRSRFSMTDKNFHTE